MAKKKTAAELDAEAQDYRNSQGALAAVNAGLRKKTFVERPKPVYAPGEVNFDAMIAPDGYSGSRQAVVPPEVEETKPNDSWYGGWEFTKDFVGSETLVGTAIHAMMAEGHKPDMKWKLPEDGSDEMKKLTDGIDPELWGAFGRAVNAEHAREIRFKILDEIETQRRMYEYAGPVGIFAANIVNPENYVMAAMTGGLSWVQKGSRLARALKNAGLSAAENVGVEAVLQETQYTRDPYDMLTGAVAGLIMGGTVGYFSKGIDDVPNAKHNAPGRDIDRIAEHEAVANGLLEEVDFRTKELRNLEGEIRNTARVSLAQRAAGALKRSELGALSRELGALRKAVQREKNLTPEVEARMLREDIESLGEDVANSKQRAKMRRNAAELEARTRQQPNIEKLARAEKLHAEKLEADDARTQLAKLDRQATRGTDDVRELLKHMDGETASRYSKWLDTARTDVAKALKLSRRHERTNPLAKPGADGKGFGTDTLSAARASDSFDVRDIVPSSDEVVPQVEFDPTTNKVDLARFIPGMQRLKQAAVDAQNRGEDSLFIRTFGKRWELGVPRWDIANTLRSLKHEAARGTLGLYVGDPVGGRGLNPIGASEVAARLFDTTKSKFHSTYEPAFRKWLKEDKGLGTLESYGASMSREYRREFGDKVDAAGRFPNGQHSPAAVQAAAKLRDLYEEFGQRAKDAGVKGFENFQKGTGYVPRVYDWQKIAAREDEFGTDVMESFLVNAVRSGMRKAGVPMEEEMEKLASLIGKGMFNTFRKKGAGIEPTAFNAVRLADIDQIAAILRDAGVDDMALTSAMQKFHNFLQPREAEAGAVRYGKHKAILDEEYTASLLSNKQGHVEMTFRDLFLVHDAEQLFESYSRSMSGNIGLAEVAGVKSAKDHADLMSKMADLIPDRKEREHALKLADRAYKLITGKPLSDPSDYRPIKRAGKFMRDYNYMRVMNQAGFAQIPDSAAWMTPGYFKYTRQHFPAAAAFFRSVRRGDADVKFAKEVEELLATGTDYDNLNLFSRVDDFEAAANSRIERGLQKLEHGVRAGGRFTSTFSGMRHLTDFNQRLAGMGAMNRIVANIAGKTKDLSPEKLANMGLGPEQIARIRAQVDKHVKWEGKHKLIELSVGQWDDPKALNDLANAAHREARRLVQEEDIGDTHSAMHTELGKFMMQFRRFPLVAYPKQFVHGVIHGDAETLMRTGMQVTLGSMSYAAQMYLYSMTKPEEEREAWRAEHLTPEKIFFGGVFRAGIFSVLPQLATTALDAVRGEENGQSFRTTGLSAGLQGVPGIDLGMRTWEAVSDIVQSASRSDMQYDQSDFDNLRKTLPFQNAFVLKQLMDHIQTMLPKADTANTDEFGYALEGDDGD